MNKSDIRKAFKNIGYKCSLKNHTLIDNGLNLSFKSECGYTNNGANVFSADTYKKHESAFKLCEQFKGIILNTGEKII